MNTEISLVTLKKLDKTGIACSGACAIHCLFLPFIAYISPAISNFLHNEWIHLGLLVLIIPLALKSFKKSLKIHSKRDPILLGSIGIILLVAAAAIESLHIEVQSLDKTLTGIGSLMLILGHTLNMSYLKKSYPS